MKKIISMSPTGIQTNDNDQRMTSLEIAEVTGKQHKNVMQAIRNMEPAWEKSLGANLRSLNTMTQKRLCRYPPLSLAPSATSQALADH